MTPRHWQAAAALAGGSLVWAGVVLDGDSTYAGFYGWLITGMGFAIGGTLGGHPLVTGVLLGAPAFVTAPWLAPRGDDDGLWVLVFPYVVFAMVCAAVAHVAGAAVARRRDRRKPPDVRT